MNIVIISRESIDNKLYWSGTINSVYSNLKLKKNFNIIKIDNLDNSLRKLFAIKRQLLKYTKNIKFDEAYDINVSKNFAKQINSKLELIEYKKISYILCFDSSLISYLQTDIPIILWTDLLYSDYYNHYFKNIKVSSDSKRSIKIIERNAIKKCYKILLTSSWSIKRAKKKYKKFSNKFKLLPFGSNLKNDVTKKHITDKIISRKKNKLHLMTLSVRWKRKGIDKILKLHKILKDQDIDSEITIIGLKKKPKNLNRGIKIVKFIDKTSKAGEKRISDHLLRNHFHILFSSAEAFGVSLVEANSRGLPNISFKIGGISQIVKNNVNGRLFSDKVNLKYVAKYIINTFKDYNKYKKLSISSYDYYKQNFSYNKIVNRFYKLIK